MNLRNYIVPIVSGKGNDLNFLGTGFFVGTEKNISGMTASHVLTELPEIEQLSYLIEAKGKKLAIPITETIIDKKRDLALFHAEGYPSVETFAIGERNAYLDEDIYNFEYSRTRPERIGSNRMLNVFPLSHRGHVMAHITDERDGIRKFVTSFPALKGSSGSPIYTPGLRGPLVVGLLTTNWESEALPAQVDRYHDNNGEVIEEIKYYVHNGLAVTVEEIKEFLTEHEMEFTIIPMPPYLR